MIQIGWIDYSKEHRGRVMSVLDMLATPGAMDELGISVIRDALLHSDERGYYDWITQDEHGG